MIPVLVAGAALVGGYAFFKNGKNDKLTDEEIDKFIDSVEPIDLEEGLRILDRDVAFYKTSHK